ncbi:Predicted Zn-dependent protease (DUF2268) [Klebsiella variicola]|nr:Predicted Zn-dependent protease (DUF2268) [Klebsiella variicola]
MSQMNLHILNAQKKLTAHCEWLQINLTDTYEQAKRLMPIHSLDVVVKAGKFVIPEKGHLGFCPEAGVIYITVDPENSAFCKNDAHSIERMFVHELHHAVRWTGPGYGSTLGEVLVSEGLAGHFSIELLVVNLSLGKASNPILFSPTIHKCLKTGIALITTIMPGFSEQEICPGG